MPRTKVSKNSKRNREDALREEKIREFDASVDKFLNMFDRKGQEKIDEINSDIRMILQRTNRTILQMKMADFLQLADCATKKFTDLEANADTLGPPESVQSICSSLSSTSLNTVRATNPNDEGYLTADGSDRGSIYGAPSTTAYMRSMQSQLSTQQRGRTPGPFSSARARRPRRSRSACGTDVVGTINLKPPTVATPAQHASRSKLRTPLVTRNKALSADRASHVIANDPKSPPSAFLRWPKPGELVVSMCGSPIVAQVMPDKFANVNIPVKNGVLSLRPKKLEDLKRDLIDSIDPETLDQIKTLQANLDLIVNMVAK